MTEYIWSFYSKLLAAGRHGPNGQIAILRMDYVERVSKGGTGFATAPHLDGEEQTAKARLFKKTNVPLHLAQVRRRFYFRILYAF